MSLGRAEKIFQAELLFQEAYDSAVELDLSLQIKDLGPNICNIVLQGIFANGEARKRVLDEPTSPFTIAVNQAIALNVLAEQVESRDAMLKRYGIT